VLVGILFQTKYSSDYITSYIMIDYFRGNQIMRIVVKVPSKLSAGEFLISRMHSCLTYCHLWKNKLWKWMSMKVSVSLR